MNTKKFVEEYGLSGFPLGLGGCMVSDFYFDSCGNDIFVFDEKKSEPDEIIKFEDEFVTVRHASLFENHSGRLLQYANLKIIQDESWDLRMLLSKINEKQSSLFSDLAKNRLIESLFCCQKTEEGVCASNVFASCWQKCASYYLADAISSLNCLRLSPSHMLDSFRKLSKNHVNEYISTVTQTVGIERATTTLLERMLKSTVGFSDIVENNNHSQIIQQKYDFFVRNSMLSDCYFYLGYINKENFIKIRDSIHRKQDLMHILKIAFDVEADSNLLLQQAKLVKKSCYEIFDVLSRA